MTNANAWRWLTLLMPDCALPPEAEFSVLEFLPRLFKPTMSWKWLPTIYPELGMSPWLGGEEEVGPQSNWMELKWFLTQKSDLSAYEENLLFSCSYRKGTDYFDFSYITCSKFGYSAPKNTGQKLHITIWKQCYDGHIRMCQPPITTVFPWDTVKNQIRWPLLLKEFPECYRFLYKIGWPNFYCHREHSFQQPLLFLNYLHITITEYAVFDIRTAFSSGKFKGFSKSNLIWTVATASCLFWGNSLINWLSQSRLKRIAVGSLLISQHSYSCPTTRLSPDELNLGEGKPKNSPLNPALSENCDTGKNNLCSCLYHFISFVFAEWTNSGSQESVKLDQIKLLKHLLIQPCSSLLESFLRWKEHFESVR